MRIILYHYTNRNGFNGITGCRRIEKSRSTHFGQGVYFTSLPPESGKNRIATNNYNFFPGLAKSDKGFVDYYVKVIFSTYDYYLENSNAGGRDVYLYKKDIGNLNCYPHEFGKVTII